MKQIFSLFSDADNAEEPNCNRKSESLSLEELKSVERVALPKEETSPEPTVPNYESRSPQTTNSTTFIDQATVKYQFGNYTGPFGGLQNLVNLSDVRLTVFLRHAYLFKDKDILDIGCNVGYMTIAVARRLHPKSIVGVDIDKSLIALARRNLRFFQRIPESGLYHMKSRCKPKLEEKLTQLDDMDKEKTSKKIKSNLRAKDRERNASNRVEYFPHAFPICFGGLPNIKYKNESPSASPASSTQNTKTSEQIRAHQEHKESCTLSESRFNEFESTNKIEAISKGVHIGTFPDNVFFRTLNYAVTEESQMISDKQQYDLILCLSLTKWIHLNFGDAGLKMTFRRMFNQLRPGGKLILEAQNWASYKKRKKLSVCNVIHILIDKQKITIKIFLLSQIFTKTTRI